MPLGLLLVSEGPALASLPLTDGALVPGERQCAPIKAHPLTEALDAKGRPSWSRFYSVKNVCVAPRPDACGTRLEAGFDEDDDSDDFDPLNALRQWLELFESGCGGTPLEGVREESAGLAFTVQHINAYNEESIQHQAAALFAMFGDAGDDKEMQKKLARVTSVVLPQYKGREQLAGEMQWLTGMLGVVLPKCVSNKCREGQRELHACAELAEPVCYDELIVHRQVGPWSASHGKAKAKKTDAAVDMRNRQLFASAGDVRRFQWRAGSTLKLPECASPSKRLTLTMAVRRDARGYMNWDELIGKTRSLVKRHPPWSLELWEPKAEDLHGQAQRLACTDLLISVQGAHAANMIFMPPRAGLLFTARCGCKYQSGFMHELASQLGLRWWDALEDCSGDQTNSAAGVSPTPTTPNPDPAQNSSHNPDPDPDPNPNPNPNQKPNPNPYRNTSPTPNPNPNQGECNAWNEHGRISSVLADFEANWEQPLTRALVALRKPNVTKGGLWRPSAGAGKGKLAKDRQDRRRSQ